MSKLTEWLRSIVGLTKADEDAIVADGEAAISRVFERLGDHLEAEMAAFHDRLTGEVAVTVGETSDPDRMRSLAKVNRMMLANTKPTLVDQAFRKKLGTRKALAKLDKMELAELIVDAE